MRATLRLLATAKPAARYLEAGQPTGLTGILTNASPRSTLLFLYSTTLDRLAELPESSLYRRSAEALTKHRLAIVEAAEPAGHAEWRARALETVRANEGRFATDASTSVADSESAILNGVRRAAAGREFVHRLVPETPDARRQEWDGEVDEGPNAEGLRGENEKVADAQAMFSRRDPRTQEKVEWEPEPQLTLEQYVPPPFILPFAPG